jgi:hypothetical protein
MDVSRKSEGPGWYPHVLILASDDRLLHDEICGDFLTNEDVKGYSREVLARFFDRWAPESTTEITR